MNYSPLKHHSLAIDWILNRPYCALWMDCGMGKTGSSLAALIEMVDRIDVVSTLIVSTPRIAEKVWAAERDKWDQFNHLSTVCLTAADLPVMWVEVIRKGKPVRVQKLVNPRELRAKIFRLVRQNSFITIHVDLLTKLVKLMGDEWPWDCVILDESSLFKNQDTNRFKAIRRVRGHIDRVIELTATPNPNGYEQLWSQIYILDQGRRLGRTITDFRERFMMVDKRIGKDRNTYKLRPGAAEEIQNLVSDICMSMSSEDWLTLPPLIHNHIPVYLPAAALADYRELENEYLVALQTEVEDVMIEASSAGALRIKLRQMANGAVYDENRAVHVVHDAKLDALEELIETNTGSLLLAYEFKHDRERIKKRFPKAVALDERPDFEEAWNRGEIQFGYMHAAQGGHGLNIQDGGSMAVWYGPPVDYELFYQFNKRLHRPGQKAASVVINQLVAQGTVDEDSLMMQTAKGIRQDQLLESVKRRVARS